MKKLTLYLLRHGESELNAVRIFAGPSVDPRLSLVGLQEAIDQAKSLENVRFAAIYSSPLLRARQTADIVAQGRRQPVLVDERLMEVNLGFLDGKYIDDPVNQAAYREVISAWEAGDLTARFASGESLAEVEARFTSFLESLYGHAYEAPVLLVAHGVLYMTVLWQIATNHGPTLKHVYMGRCHLSIITGSDNRYEILQFNIPPKGPAGAAAA
jgi:phosphoserine phosphatase